MFIFNSIFEAAAIGPQYTDKDVRAGYGSMIGNVGGGLVAPVIGQPLGAVAGHYIGQGQGTDEPIDPTSKKDRVGVLFGKHQSPANVGTFAAGALAGAGLGGAIGYHTINPYGDPQRHMQKSTLIGASLGAIPGMVMSFRRARRSAKNLGYGKIGTTLGSTSPAAVMITGLTKPKLQREVERDIKNQSNGKNRSKEEIKKLIRDELQKRLSKIQNPDE